MDPGDERLRKLPSYICVPDFTATVGTTFVTRVIKDGHEAESIPDLVTNGTEGCSTFDVDCQRLVASRNANQLFKSGNIEDSGLFASGAGTHHIDEWWRTLTGDLTLPAASVTVSLRTKGNGSAAPDAAKEEDELCDNVVKAVLDADHAYKLVIGVTSAFTYAVATDCITVGRSRQSQTKPQAIGGRITVDQAFADQVLADTRKTMKLPILRGADMGRPLLGVWDGPIANGPELSRPGVYPKLTLKPTLTNPGGNTLLESSVISWVDPFPLSGLGDPPGAPCGAPLTPDERHADHATVIASMLAGKTDGLLPNARIWSYIWDPRRLEMSKSVGPGASIAWFGTSVSEASKLNLITIANLSCGVRYGEKDELDAYSGLRTNLVGIGDPATATTVAPYVISIAAGNRSDRDEPTAVDARLTTSGMPDIGGGGYPFLARNHATSGAISVVGLGPSGEDVLQCGQVQELIAKARRAGFRYDNEEIVGNVCPVSPGVQDDFSDPRPLVVYGTAFDVGAIGVGAGDGEDGKPLVMWGSSFAAPYVTGLAAEIYERARSVTNKVLIPANFIADRIRFTADSIGDGSLVKYGRIDGDRALAFEHDQFEFGPFDAESGAHTAEQAEVQQCQASGGRLELNRKNKGYNTLLLADNTRVSLRSVQRIRLDPTGHYEEIDRGSQDSPSSYSLTTRRLADIPALIPIVCVRDKTNRTPMLVHLDTVTSFTRCSFMGAGCDF